MKFRILFLFLFCCAKMNFAQLYQPFPNDSAVWRQQSNQWDPPWMTQQDYKYYLQGDTLLSGITYHKLYKALLESTYYTSGGPFLLYSGPYMTDTNKYIGAIRE